MSDRPPRLPPLNALRVFHTVVRHRSFRAAADELLVTPQAVSQQIKLLEDTLGIELFERKGRAIEPNENSILLAHFVQAGFDEFAEGVRRVTRTSVRNRINLNVSPYFAPPREGGSGLLGRTVTWRALMQSFEKSCSTARIFYSLKEAQILIEAWRRHYYVSSQRTSRYAVDGKRLSCPELGPAGCFPLLRAPSCRMRTADPARSARRNSHGPSLRG